MPVAKRRPAAEPADGWTVRPRSWVFNEHANTVDAEWYGPHVAVHESVSRRGQWAVVAVPCEYVLVHVLTRADAKMVAEIVVATLDADLALADGEELKRRFPRWFRHWGVAVRRAGAYLDPGPYLDGKLTDNVIEGAMP